MRTVQEAIKDKVNFKCIVYKKDIVSFLKYCFANGLRWGAASKDLYRSYWQWNHTYFVYYADGLSFTQNIRIYDVFNLNQFYIPRQTEEVKFIR